MSGAHVFIDHSQFPASVQRDLLDSLRRREINHKFHYQSYKQAARWLALHEAYSPARTDASCPRIYDDAFLAAVQSISGPHVHLVGLGCGGGQKEARFLELLRRQGIPSIATLLDVSLPLVLTAREAALPNTTACHGIVCDLGTSSDLAGAIDGADKTRARVLTLFGVLPNFEPAPLLSRIAPLLRPRDLLLIGANLAPGSDYRAGVQQVLPQYDNDLTRDWLMTLLSDLGLEKSDGELGFEIQTDVNQLHRIVANFHIRQHREITVSGERFSFASGERIRVFFSCRHTCETMRRILGAHRMSVQDQWLNDSGEEGVFLCRKSE